MKERPENWNDWNKDKQWGYLRGLANGRLETIKHYSEEDVKTMVKRAVDLHIPLYPTTTIAEIEILIKHGLLKNFGEEIPIN